MSLTPPHNTSPEVLTPTALFENLNAAINKGVLAGQERQEAADKRYELQENLRISREEKLAKEQQNRMDAILSEHADRARKKFWQLVFKILKWVGAISALPGGFLGYSAYTAPPAPPVVSGVDVQSTVVKEADAVNARIKTVEKNQQTLGRGVVRNHVLITDTHEDLKKRMDAMSPAAREVVEPKSVKDAKIESRKIKEKMGAAKMFGLDIDSIDPFELLPKEK